VPAKSCAGGAGDTKRWEGTLGVSAGRALAKLICALALPAGLNQAILASTAKSATRRQSIIPNAVSRECRIKKPPCIFNSLAFVNFRKEW